MRKISRKISLEPFKSRVPSTLDSYNSNPTMIEIDSTANGDTDDAILLQIDLSGLTNSSVISQGNYGKIPRNVEKGSKNYSWATISQRHKFYKDYYDLLMPKDECRITPYSSAMEYYTYNILPTDIKGNLKPTYEQLDIAFEQYSRETPENFIFEECYNEVMIPWGKEFKYGSENLTLSYDLYYEWNCLTMYYTTIVKWLAWFEERYSKYKDIDDCNDSNDCCDCEEYIRLGGADMYKWLSSVKFNKNVTYADASITIPIFIGNTIDDLGEMSNMAEEWEPGVDYGNTLVDNIGAVVSYLDNDWMIISSGKTGTKYNDTYKEMHFGNLEWDDGTCLDGEYIWGDEDKHWTRRIDKYYKNNAEFILSGETSGDTYAYKDGRYVNSPSNSIMSDTYMIDSNNGDGYCLINDILYPIETINYVQFVSNDKFLRKNNGKIYEVYQHDDSYYTIVDGVTYIASKKTFTFNQVPCFYSGNTSEVKDGKFIRYKNGLYQVEGDYVQIDTNKKYKTIYGYFTTKNKKRYYVSSGTTYEIVKPKITEEVGNLKLHSWTSGIDKIEKYYRVYDWEVWDNNPLGISTSASTLTQGTYKLTSDKIEICPYYNVYNKDYISGKTESKLSSLRTYSIAKDDLSNQLPGMFQRENLSGPTISNEKLYNDKLVQFGKFPFKKPTKNGEWLDCYYQVGNVSDVEVVSDDYYWGNLLHSMEFYYEDASGAKLQETSVLITTETVSNNKVINNGNIGSGLTYHYSYSGVIDYDFSSTTLIDKTLNWLPTTSGITDLLPFVTNVNGVKFDIIGKSGISGETSGSINTEIESKISGNAKKSGVPISSLDAIKICNILYDIYVVNNGVSANISDTMRCRINYNIGAIFSGETATKYQLCDNKHKGVEYSETLDVIPNTCIYYINEMTQLELNYYDLKPKIEKVRMNDYGNAQADTRMADFKVQISYWKSNDETNDTDIFSSITDDNTYFDPMNDLTAFPMMRRECCLGFSSMENIKGDIYIDRGVARAFDSHLKMGEVKSFEALENYGNGSFRIEIS